MNKELPVVRLGEVCADITVGHVGPMTTEYRESGVPFLRSKNIIPFGVSKADLKFIDEEFHRKLKKSALCPGDVVVVRTGKPGTTAVIPESLPEANCSDLVIIRTGPKLDERYLAYFLNSVAKNQVSSVLVGAVQQHFNIGEAKRLKLPLPTMGQQRRVVEILAGLDDKIELNRQIVRTLEELAQRLFKSWFVDFDPVRAKMAGRQPARTPPEIADLFPDRLVDSPLGPIPEGWEFRPLVDFADFVNGKNFTKHASGDGRMVIRIAELNSGPGARTVWNNAEAEDKYIAEPGTILFAWSGSLGVHRWYRDPALINQHIFKVIPHEGISQVFCYQAVQHLIEEFRQIAASKAVTMGHIKRSDLKEHGLHVPQDFRLVAAFSDTASSLWDRALLLEQECETLSQLRDRLLPKLISGEGWISQIYEAQAPSLPPKGMSVE